jgi:hypothetical protein
MHKIFAFNKGYFISTIALFVTEVLIARYAHDAIVRPYIGDMLVVVLIYCFIRSFLKVPILPTALGVLVFACFVEALQYAELLRHLGWQNSPTARVLLGSAFSWEDILMYALGIALVLWVEKKHQKYIA